MVYKASGSAGGFFVAESGIKKKAFRPPLNADALLLSGSSDGAGFRARAAFDADFGIDFVLAVSLSDRRYGALRSAGAAADAFVRNLVSHNIPP